MVNGISDGEGPSINPGAFPLVSALRAEDRDEGEVEGLRALAA